MASASLGSFASEQAINNQEAQKHELEHIEIVGQLSSGLLESNIQLKESSSPDLRAQLAQIPGVSVNGNGLVSGIIQYRGLFGDRVNVKIDDVSIAGAGPNAMDSPLSHVIGSEHQVILHQGIAPVSAGFETLGGAIEIKPKSPEFSDSNHWMSSGRIESTFHHNNNARSFNSNLNFASDKRYLTAIAQFQEADNYEVKSLEVPSTFYQRGGAKILFGQHSDDSKLDISIARTHTNGSGTPALAMDIESIEALWYKLSYQQDLNNQWSTQIKVSANKNTHEMNNFMFRDAPMPAMHRRNSVDSSASAIDISLIKQQSDSQLEICVSGENKAHNSRISNPNNKMFFINNFNDVERSVLSGFVEYEFTDSHKIDWQLGLRASKVEYDADDVSTSMAMMNANADALVNGFNNADKKQNFGLLDLVLKARTQVSTNLNVTASLGQKQRAPSYTELYSWFPLGVSAGLADGRNYIGDLGLEKEKALQFDLGLQYQNNGLTLLPNIFYQDISDYIIGVPTDNQQANMMAMIMGAQPALQWSNQKAALYGFDMYAAYAFSQNLQVTGSVKWVRGKLRPSDDIIEGEESTDLYRIAPLTATMHAVYKLNDWTVDFLVETAAKQDKVASLQNESETPSYTVFDLAIHYQISDAFSASLLIENLGDRFYVNHLGGINRINSADISAGERIPEIGRNIGVSVDFRF
ncbi:iron complex outermembrane recepter protein [Glaciecola sp. KUL10]|nr:iron complex outermembrane recepter protein [Glaciecola sp. KUL10]